MSYRANLEEIEQVCRDNGWTAIGADYDLSAWLRDHFKQFEQLKRRDPERGLSPHATRPSGFDL